MILELIVALSLPLWLVIEEIQRIRRSRRREAQAVARTKSRRAALESLLSRTT